MKLIFMFSIFFVLVFTSNTLNLSTTMSRSPASIEDMNCLKAVRYFLFADEGELNIRQIGDQFLKWNSTKKTDFIVLENSEQIVLAVKSAIQKAKTEILLEASNINNDEILNLLIKKQNEGVSVTVLSSVPSVRFRPSHAIVKMQERVEKLKISGVAVVSYPEQKLERRSVIPTVENHRKIVIVDQQEAYVGSSNLSGHGTNIDHGFLMRGSAVELITHELLNDLQEVKQLARIRPSSVLDVARDADLEIITESELKTTLLNLVKQAKNSITIMAYELSDDDLIKELILKLKNDPHMKISILLDRNKTRFGIGPFNLSFVKNEKALTLLQNAGAEVGVLDETASHTYRIHAKTAIIDHNKSIIGSGDFTRKGLEGNVELDLLVYSEAIAKQLEGSIFSWRKFEDKNFKYSHFDFINAKVRDFLIDSLILMKKIKMKVKKTETLSYSMLRKVSRRTLGKAFSALYNTKSGEVLHSASEFMSVLDKELNNLLFEKKYKVQISEVWDQTEPPTPILFLGTNRKKAEEVKTGLLESRNSGTFGKGVYLTNSVSSALDYALIRAKQTMSSPNIIGLTYDTLRMYEGDPRHVTKERLLAEGYDGVLIKDAEGEGEDYYLILNTEKLRPYLRVELI